jgi:hypothetical protein
VRHRAAPALLAAHNRQDPISRWAHALRERSGWQVAAVALANHLPSGSHLGPRTILGSCRVHKAVSGVAVCSSFSSSTSLRTFGNYQHQSSTMNTNTACQRKKSL